MNLTDTNITKQNYSLEQDNGGYTQYAYIHFTVAAAVALGLCLIGLVGNIIVFWYLCFKIQGNKYTIYIINLAVADSILIIFSAMLLMININTMIGTNPNFQGEESFNVFVEVFYDSMQYTGMFLLTAISMERCMSVLFPLWYQCYRPHNLSTIMCAFLWVIGCLESLIENLVCTPEAFMKQTSQCTAVQIMTFVLAIGICLPIMVISSFILLINIKRIFGVQYPPKLYIIIITAVLFFILSIMPFNFLWFFVYFQLLTTNIQAASLFFASIFSIVLNSTINPYIYFIVGRKWKQSSNHSIHDALQRAFKIEDEETEDTNSNKTINSSCQNIVISTS
ncbi:mas-related G-protein coupled receptor member H-like [Pseudophryne corroboree]|uniref:mas-related G-protein coupled receptor member H-like n=1 Tax=Pseudophryne corroboree TaxID=495146 RepID=UPI0030813AAB